MSISFYAESWIWYAIGAAIVVARLVSRSLLFQSVRKLQIDDWTMLVALASHTAFIVTINMETHYSSNLLEQGQTADDFSEEEIASRVFGSKLTVVVEQLQCLTIWLIKACLVILYYRVTKSLKTNRLVIALGVYLAITYILMTILYFAAWCRPFHNYYAVPTPNPDQCSAAKNHLITYAVFNISSDLALLAIAFSLFIGNTLPWHRKLILSFVFGLGLFSILSAVLNKYYSFTHPFGGQWTFWYVRESSTALIIANIPFTWTILRRIFNLQSFDGDSDSGSQIQYHSSRSARGRLVAQNPKPAPPHSYLASRNSSVLNSLSPAHTRHTSLAIDTEKARRLRAAGVFGREDADALGVDIYESSSNPTSVRHSRIYSSDNMTIRSADGADSIASSPRTRRLRDEEAQLAMQEDIMPTYHDFLKMLHDEHEEKTTGRSM